MGGEGEVGGAVGRAGAPQTLDELVQPSDAQRQAARVQLDEAPELGGVGQRQLDRLVDAARAGGQRGLQHVGAVGGSQEQDVGVLGEAVHLVEQLEQDRTAR